MKKNINKWIAVLLTATILTGCTGSFEEINTDPDALSSVPATNMLGNIIRRTAEQIGGDMDGYGTFAGYIVKIQYMDYLSGLIPTNNTFGNRWYNCYYGNTQLGIILENTEDVAEGNKNIRWAARIFQNYLWLYNLDTWGDMPYSEALKGAPEKGGILNAKYDKESEIYPDLIAKLKTIADEMAAGHGTDDIGEGDFLFGGDVLKWQKFCNSLRLRAAIRLSNVDAALSRSVIEEIAANPAKYPLINTNDDNAYFWWQNSAPYFERWYDNFRTRDDHGLFDTFIDFMKEMEDPRLHVIAKPAPADGEYHGFRNGSPTNPQLKDVSRIGTLYRENPAGFTPFYKSCETYYILAEAAMLGWNTGISAAEAYEKAVRLSMEDNGVADEDTEAYLSGKGKWNNTKERILWDQWIALFKENHEAWCLYRRTGIPTSEVNYVSVNSVFGTKHNDQPFRMPYPNNEYLYNEDKLKEALNGIEDYCWGKQLWWDTRTGVH
jgi:hypothetical protein